MVCNSLSCCLVYTRNGLIIWWFLKSVLSHTAQYICKHKPKFSKTLLTLVQDKTGYTRKCIYTLFSIQSWMMMMIGTLGAKIWQAIHCLTFKKLNCKPLYLLEVLNPTNHGQFVLVLYPLTYWRYVHIFWFFLHVPAVHLLWCE